MKRLRAVVAYDGSDYSGFQRQANAPTVQETLEDALAQVTQAPTSIVAAGRTDAGVHAAGQVIAFDTDWFRRKSSLRRGYGPSDLERALNAVLPEDVAVRQVREAGERFHPRYDAKKRRYRYYIYNSPQRWPLIRRYSLHVDRPLNVEAMEEAAKSLVGEHDFATFGQPPQGEVTVRRVFAATWGTDSFPSFAPGGGWFSFDVEANAFLYHMVRSVVGTLLQVGLGKMDVRAFRAALKARDRAQAGPTAPPHGLCLMTVTY